jgi:hypothetical protein
MRSAEARRQARAEVLRIDRYRQPSHDREPSPQQQYMLGDPSVRVVDVYVPAGTTEEGCPASPFCGGLRHGFDRGDAFPSSTLLVDLIGFTNSGFSETNWAGFPENLPERLDRLIGEERMPPAVVPGTHRGRVDVLVAAEPGETIGKGDYLLHEMLSAIEQRFGW